MIENGEGGDQCLSEWVDNWCKEGSPSSGEQLYIYEDADKQPLILMPFQMCFNHETFAAPLPEGFID